MSVRPAFVPTMGALHAGHLSLIELAQRYSEEVILSIFVNPLQFENSDDLAKYPRDLAADSALAMAAGATQIWAPTVDEIYPADVELISSGALGLMYEGVNRPGHFDGVLTVVDRLFKKINPSHAIFGEKDFQQLFIINRWVKENELPVQIVPAPLIRDHDGLALSSRNSRLTAVDRDAALVIQRALFVAVPLRDPQSVITEVLATEPAFTLDYAVIIDEENFEVATTGRALVAGWVNGIRLLDNMVMGSRS